MVRYLPTSHFFVLLFVVVLLLCNTLCVAGYASSFGTAIEKIGTNLFEPGKIKSVQRSNGGENLESITLKEIKLPSFLVVAKKNVMVAVAEASYIENSGVEKKYDVVARFVETSDITNWGTDVIARMNEKWKTQLATENNEREKTFSKIIASTVNAEGDKIYVLLLGSADSGSINEWKFKLVTGDVSTTENKDTLIKWKAHKLTVPKENTKIKELNDEKFFFNGDNEFFLFTKNTKILFVVKGTSFERSGDDSFAPKHVTVCFQFEEAKGKLTLSNVISITGWYLFFQWEGEIFKAPTNYPNGDNKDVMMFNTSNNVFKKSDKSILYLRDFLKDKSNFVTANIQGINVLLFTQRKIDDRGISDAHLWITDGSRVGYAGPIITRFTGIFYGSVLYTNNELFALHEKYEEGGKKEENKFVFARLNGQLEIITEILNAWKKNNEKIKEHCENTKTTVIPCSTDGLVGFLSDTEINDSWTDKYNYTNATVTQNTDENREKVKRVDSGFTFSGDGVGAKWEVGKKQNEDWLYNFTDLGFTLVATVKIGKNEKENEFNSVLGVGVKELLHAGATKNIGLSCSKNDKFVINDKTNTPLITTDADCVLGKPYSIAFVLKNENLEIYVNGKQLILVGKKIIIKKQDNIEHFYFGANSGTTPLEKTAVTITNVLLYNRPFTEEEIKQFQPKQNNEAGVQSISKNDTGNSQESGKKKIETDISSDTSTTQNKNENKSSTTEDSAARVGVVGVLCFMLCGVFTLLGRYVY